MDDAKLEPIFQVEERGFLVGNVIYTGLYEIEQLEVKPFIFFTMVLLWLNEYGGDRNEREELQDIAWDINTEDDGQVSLAIGISFIEPIYLTENDSGDFKVNGTRYSLGEGQAEVAEKMGLSSTALSN